MNQVQELQILLVEDDDIDAMAFQRHLGSRNPNVRIHRAIDGAAALELLRGPVQQGACTDIRSLEQADSPFVIVLDLNMPRMSGLEFLQELREDPQLRRSIVFVFTTSDAAEDRMACFEHNVAGYLLKSRAGERFQNVAQLLESYVSIAEFPPYFCQKSAS